MAENPLDVMIIEPVLNDRVELRSMINRHAGFRRCLAASTLMEASDKVRAGYPIDAFFLSSKLDAAVIGSFVELTRSSKYLGAANLLVIAPQTKVISAEIRATNVDGFLLQPYCPEDLDPAVEFVSDYNRKRELSNKTRVQHNLGEHLRAICAQASLALDTGNLARLRDLRESIDALDEGGKLSLSDSICEYFCQFAEQQDYKATSR
jgi:response regulator of citrate/malate metabolism